jgi:hypothetical protein
VENLQVSFSTNMAKLVTDQLSRFVTLNRHQLAGHVANLEFWLAQVRHSLQVIDGYGARFRLLKTAQEKHVAEHHTVEFDLDDRCCTRGKPDTPRKVAESELKDARVALTQATRRFLVRCYSEGLIDEAVFRKACQDSGIGFDPTDLARVPRKGARRINKG